jgi:sigma-B regulation protein RsbQ
MSLANGLPDFSIVEDSYLHPLLLRMTPPDILRRNNVRVLGSGPKTVLMVHGFGCDQEVWRFLVPVLEQDARVVLFDFTGFGQSDFSCYRDEDFRSLDDYATTLLEVMDALDTAKVSVVAHSVSTIIAALASLRAPGRFEALSMICPSPCYLNDPPGYEGGFNERDVQGLLGLLETNDFHWASVFADAVSPEKEGSASVREELEKRFCAALPKAARTWARLTFLGDYRHILAEIPVPTQIFQCRVDTLAPVGVGKLMEREIPQSQLVLLDAIGHCPHLTHPHLLFSSLRTFLQVGAQSAVSEGTSPDANAH